MDNRINQAFDKETSFRTLEVINSWIGAADNKSSILMAFIALLVGLSANTYGQVSNLIMNGSNVEITLIIIFGMIYLIVLGLAIYHLVSVFIARTKKEDIFANNLVSFIAISNMSADEYIGNSKKINEEELCEMILSQININSKIVRLKMKHFNYAMMFSVLMIPITIVMTIIVG